jgi:hypothetical protein
MNNKMKYNNISDSEDISLSSSSISLSSTDISLTTTETPECPIDYSIFYVYPKIHTTPPMIMTRQNLQPKYMSITWDDIMYLYVSILILSGAFKAKYNNLKVDMDKLPVVYTKYYTDNKQTLDFHINKIMTEELIDLTELIKAYNLFMQAFTNIFNQFIKIYKEILNFDVNYFKFDQIVLERYIFPLSKEIVEYIQFIEDQSKYAYDTLFQMNKYLPNLEDPKAIEKAILESFGLI